MMWRRAFRLRRHPTMRFVIARNHAASVAPIPFAVIGARRRRPARLHLVSAFNSLVTVLVPLSAPIYSRPLRRRREQGRVLTRRGAG